LVDGWHRDLLHRPERERGILMKATPPFRALATALVLSSAACGIRWSEQSMRSYEAPADNGCAAAADAEPYLASHFVKKTDTDSPQELLSWSVDEGPFVSAALDDEASLPAESWTSLRCAYLVTENRSSGPLPSPGPASERDDVRVAGCRVEARGAFSDRCSSAPRGGVGVPSRNRKPA
jgi:hypothetical protein